MLENLQPKGFFKWFEEITRIPHGSGHEEKLAAFLENFAKERNLECIRDRWNNVLIRLPATPGYENEPSILLQGHMDMVWAKDATASINLATDPLELSIDGNKLTAKGTTLGADDGVAVATMLAIADDATIPHPAMELFCTVDEETGLIGMRNADLSVIKSRRMVNLDAGNSHQICVSATGAKMVVFEKKYTPVIREGLQQLHLHLAGGLGGHAGILAHKNRACCINIMGELLFMLGKQMPVYLSELVAEGPSIHGSCEAWVSVPQDSVGQAESVLKDQFAILNKRYEKSDPNVTLEIIPLADAKPICSLEDSSDMIRAMFLIHTGVRRSDADDLSIIVTSVTMSKIALENGNFSGALSIRSLDDLIRDSWYYRVEEWLRLIGIEAKVKHEFTAWPGSAGDVMQNRFKEHHKRLYGEDIDILHLHASIEANILLGQIPDMDAVAIQPTAADFHTPKETLFIDQVQPYWDLLLAILAQKD